MRGVVIAGVAFFFVGAVTIFVAGFQSKSQPKAHQDHGTGSAPSAILDDHDLVEDDGADDALIDDDDLSGNVEQADVPSPASPGGTVDNGDEVDLADESDGEDETTVETDEIDNVRGVDEAETIDSDLPTGADSPDAGQRRDDSVRGESEDAELEPGEATLDEEDSAAFE